MEKKGPGFGGLGPFRSLRKDRVGQGSPLGVPSTDLDQCRSSGPTQIRRLDPQANELNLFSFLNFSKTFILGTIGYTAIIFITGTLAWWIPTAVDYAMCMNEDPSKCHDIVCMVNSTNIIPFNFTTCPVEATLSYNYDKIKTNSSYALDKGSSFLKIFIFRAQIIFGTLVCIAGILGVIIATITSQVSFLCYSRFSKG